MKKSNSIRTTTDPRPKTSPRARAITRSTSDSARFSKTQAIRVIEAHYLSPDFDSRSVVRELDGWAVAARIRFRREFGTSIRKHLAARRVGEAAAILRANPPATTSLGEVAPEAGFTDAAALDSAFRSVKRTSAFEYWLRAHVGTAAARAAASTRRGPSHGSTA